MSNRMFYGAKTCPGAACAAMSLMNVTGVLVSITSDEVGIRSEDDVVVFSPTCT